MIVSSIALTHTSSFGQTETQIEYPEDPPTSVVIFMIINLIKPDFTLLNQSNRYKSLEYPLHEISRMLRDPIIVIITAKRTGIHELTK